MNALKENTRHSKEYLGSYHVFIVKENFHLNMPKNDMFLINLGNISLKVSVH